MAFFKSRKNNLTSDEFNARKSGETSRSNSDINKVSGKIDGESVEDVRAWAQDKILQLSDARDTMVPSLVADGYTSVSSRSSSRHAYVNRTVENYGYFHDLKRMLLEDADFRGGVFEKAYSAENFLQQMMRDKFSVFADANTSFRYEPLDGTDNTQVNFIYELNQIVPKRIRDEGFNEARLDAIAQTSAYGTSIILYLHTMTKGEPDGVSFFEVADPLGFLVEFGSTKINGRGTKVSKTFVIVRMRDPKEIEREWGKKLSKEDSKKNFVDPREFSLMHALDYTAYNTGTLNDITDKIPEVMVFYDDQETEKVIVDVPIMRIKKDIDGNDVVDKNGDFVEEPVIVDGVPQTEKFDTKTSRMVYPKGRLMVFAADQVCYDGQTIYEHGLRPGAPLHNTWDGVNFFALGDPDIGGDTQRAITKMNGEFQRNINSMSGVLGVNTKALVNPDEDVIKREGDVDTVKLNVPSGSAPIKEIMEWWTPPVFGQEQLMYYRDKINEGRFIFGASRESLASESGKKLQLMDEREIRFQNPIVVSEELGLHYIGMMWLSNLRQFDRERKVYPVQGRSGERGAPMVLSGESPQLFDTEGSVIHFPITTHRDFIGASNRQEEIKLIGEALPLIDGSPLGDQILIRLGIPDLLEQVVADRQARAEQARLLELAKEAGLFDALADGKVSLEDAIKEIQTKARNANGS